MNIIKTIKEMNNIDALMLENSLEREKTKIIEHSIELIQLVIHKYKIKNIEGITCPVHKKLAEILDNHGWLKWYSIPGEYNFTPTKEGLKKYKMGEF